MAVRFDAATDRISITASLPNPVDGITITAWAYTSVNTATNATLARLWTDAGATTSVTFATDSDGLAGPGYFTGGGSVVATTDMAVGEWRKVAFGRSGATGHVYVATPAGVTEHVSGAVGGAANPTGMTLGGRSPVDGSEFFNGRLAYVRVWTGLLDQTQVEAEWSATAPVVTSGLWADWPLATAGDLTDHSGNGRNLTAGSTPVTTEDGPPLANEVTGVATANLGPLSATVTGTREVTGVATGTLGALSATAVGTRASVAVATGALGALTALATGARSVIGAAIAALGGLGATIVGTRSVDGVATANLGTLTATASSTGVLPTERLRVSGREPNLTVSGREPRRTP